MLERRQRKQKKLNFLRRCFFLFVLIRHRQQTKAIDSISVNVNEFIYCVIHEPERQYLLYMKLTFGNSSKRRATHN